MDDSKSSSTTTEQHVTAAGIASLLRGEGGVDLAPVIEDGKQVVMRIFGVSPGSTAVLD